MRVASRHTARRTSWPAGTTRRANLDPATSATAGAQPMSTDSRKKSRATGAEARPPPPGGTAPPAIRGREGGATAPQAGPTLREGGEGPSRGAALGHPGRCSPELACPGVCGVCGVCGVVVRGSSCGLVGVRALKHAKRNPRRGGVLLGGGRGAHLNQVGVRVPRHVHAVAAGQRPAGLSGLWLERGLGWAAGHGANAKISPSILCGTVAYTNQSPTGQQEGPVCLP